MTPAEEWLQHIVGKQLSSVTFVQDYWQLDFDGVRVTALTRVIVHADGSTLRDGENQFRNLLCGQIAKIVARAELIQPEALTVTFEDGTSIAVSLKWEDYSGPEAIHLSSIGGPQIIIRADG
jgi:hypothetical protein